MINLLRSLISLTTTAPCGGTAPSVATAFTRATKVTAAKLLIVLLLSGSTLQGSLMLSNEFEAAVVAGGGLALQGSIMLSNLPNSNDGGSTIGATTWKAVVFTTGSQPTTLSTVTVGLNPNPTSASVPMTQNVTVSLYSVTDNTPNTLLATTGLTPVTMQARQELYSFISIAGTAMEASTAYALVLSSDASAIKWGNNGLSGNTPTDSGFTYNRFVQTADSGASWTGSPAENNAFSIAVVPEPSSYALLIGAAALGLVAARRRR